VLIAEPENLVRISLKLPIIDNPPLGAVAA
jgi:hypothetical protein